MSHHRQNDYKSRGGRGSAFSRLGLPVRNEGNYRGGGRGPYQPRGGDRGGYRGRGGRGRGRYQHPRGGAHQFHVGKHEGKLWFKVTITRGAEFQKEAILKALGSYIEQPLWPVLYKLHDGDATFFLDDKDAADSVEAASRRVALPNGPKLNIRVVQASPPYVPLDKDQEEAIRAALQHRYDAANQHLNLSAFSSDAALQDQRTNNLSLQRNNVMMSIVDMIGREREVADSIKSIDISDNRLRFMEYFGCLVPRVPNVIRLIMHHNQVEDIHELEKLSAWKLMELDLDQTPLCGKFNSKENYIEAVRRVFRKLIRLDGTDLPPPTTFGLDEDEVTAPGIQLPPFKPSFFVDDTIKDLVIKFIELYYTYFDSEDRLQRDKLLEAYDDDATFTMASGVMTSESASNIARGSNWHDYNRDSHNIMKMDKWEKFRQKLVQRGKLAILAYLTTAFPPSSHIPDSFIVDISFASGNVLLVNVTGVFRDRSSEEPGRDLESLPLRLFNRVFMLLQNEKGLCVVNETVFVSPMTPNQYTGYMKQVMKSREDHPQ